MSGYREQRDRVYQKATATTKELFDRKSVRVFTDQPISEEAREQILYAAFEAPSGGCQQLYTIIDVSDQEKKNQLADSCDHQPFIAQAQMVLVFCADCKKWLDAYHEAGIDARKPGEGDLMISVTDAAIAAQNAVTAAWSLGIGSCYIGDIMEQYETNREILALPEYVMPAVMVVFGYPAESQKKREKPLRFEEKFMVYENSYPTERDTRAMLDTRRGSQDYDSWVKAFCERKYQSDFALEMTRSVHCYLDQVK